MANEVNLSDEFSDKNSEEITEDFFGDPLWNAMKGGCNTAFEQIFKSYYPSLLHYGLRFHKDEEEVKDCIQILFLTIWERKQFLGSLQSVKNYLLISLRRLILKRKKDLPSFVEIQSGDADTDLSDFSIELSIEVKMIHDQTLRENIEALQKAIHHLPSRQKEALYLKFYDEQSFAEIAQVMEISPRAVYKLIYKALDSLNDELAPQTKNIPFLLSVFFALLFSASTNLPLKESSLSALLE